MSYNNYQTAIRKRINALKADKILLRQNNFVTSVPFFASFSVVVGIMLLSVDHSSLVHMIVWPLAYPAYKLGLPLPLFNLVVFGPFALLTYWAAAKWLRPLFNVATPDLPCPHCALGNNLNQYWKCGWCHKNNRSNDPLKKDQSVIDPCMHEDCMKQASAFICEHCGQDIVLDIDTYNAKQDFGHLRREGVAKLIKRSEVAKLLDLARS